MGKDAAYVETASIAPSEATTLVNDRYYPQNVQVIPGSTMLYVRLPVADLQPLDPNNTEEESKERRSSSVYSSSSSAANLAAPEVTNGGSGGKKPGWTRRLSASITGKKHAERSKDQVRMVQMTRDEYDMYWARDEAGNYIGTAPEGSGREWYRRKLQSYGRAMPKDGSQYAMMYGGGGAIAMGGMAGC
ncbi:hypothetical protein LTR16_001180 [Cryomyces antarcticus]|uniref:Uncharacterized protein n=1 Tax=Cryomyces antarcticus TaxID=329879 RepID=A0ABR0LZG7_9PEZI|nr:hypothetical protein LTR16_001180 [Cryomyces antarcticus]